MSNKPQSAEKSPRLLRGDTVAMPNYHYQRVCGQSGDISSKKSDQPVKRFNELGNFVLGG